MERNRALCLFLPLLSAIASAAEELPAQQSEILPITRFILDSFVPAFGVLLLLFLLSSLGDWALGYRFRFFGLVATALGVVLAIVLVLAGLVSLSAFGVLAWSIAVKDETFARAPEWAVPLADEIRYRAQPLLEMALGPESLGDPEFLRAVIMGLLLVGGGLFLVLGLLLVVRLLTEPISGFIGPRGGPTTFREVMTRGQEPLSPTVTFRVIDRHTNQPSPDVKVILKHKEGGKIYTRYTDFNGEVIFQKIDGLFSQYYAYVDGDEERKKYFVIRTAIGAETVT